jgi:hypothetical protein
LHFAEDLCAGETVPGTLQISPTRGPNARRISRTIQHRSAARPPQTETAEERSRCDEELFRQDDRRKDRLSKIAKEVVGRSQSGGP